MKDSLSISISSEDIERAELFLSALGEQANKYVKHALNRSIKGVTTDTAKLVPGVFNVKSGSIRKTSKTYSAGKSSGGFKASAIFRGKKVLAKHFSPKPGKRLKRQPQRGISIFLRKGEKFTLDGSFFGKNKKGENQIYKRIGTPFIRDGRKTQNLTKPSLLSIPYMIKMSETADEIQNRAVERFNKNLDHNMKRALSKRG
jgi:hypothetical protein